MNSGLTAHLKEIIKNELPENEHKLSTQPQLKILEQRKKHDIDCYLKCAFLRISEDDATDTHIKVKRQRVLECLHSILKPSV